MQWYKKTAFNALHRCPDCCLNLHVFFTFLIIKIRGNFHDVIETLAGIDLFFSTGTDVTIRSKPIKNKMAFSVTQRKKKTKMERNEIKPGRKGIFYLLLL